MLFSRKNKLFGISALLLGTPSSISLSNIDLSRLALNNLFSSSGGAQITKLGEPDHEIRQKLSVGGVAKELGKSQRQELNSPVISEVKEAINLSKHQGVNDKNSGDTISTTYKEIDKEDKTLLLGKESESKYIDAKKKSSIYLDKFLSGKAKIDAFDSRQSGTSTRRKRRSIAPYTFVPLTHEERKAFYEMYKIFESLEKDQKNLLPKLHTIAGTEAIAIPEKDKPSSSSIKHHLTAINWNNPGDNRYTTERSGGYGRPNIPNAWISWDSNPFKPFFNQPQDYTDLINKVKKLEKERSDYSRSKRLLGLLATGVGPRTVRSTYSGLGKFESQLKEAKETFTNKVALKFLDWMGQRGKRV